MEPIDQLIADEQREQVSMTIRQLPETERLIFNMRSVEGFSESDTAACIAMPAAKVRRCLERARLLLRQRLL